VASFSFISAVLFSGLCIDVSCNIRFGNQSVILLKTCLSTLRGCARDVVQSAVLQPLLRLGMRTPRSQSCDACVTWLTTKKAGPGIAQCVLQIGESACPPIGSSVTHEELGCRLTEVTWLGWNVPATGGIYTGGMLQDMRGGNAVGVFATLQPHCSWSAGKIARSAEHTVSCVLVP
jgi:hypothetical protein